jgi:hypothetical protein
MARREPVSIRGIEYPSQSSSARALGITPQAVFLALENGAIDNAGTGRNKRRPVTISGVEYRSIQEAARATGVSYSVLQRRVASGA